MNNAPTDYKGKTMISLTMLLIALLVSTVLVFSKSNAIDLKILLLFADFFFLCMFYSKLRSNAKEIAIVYTVVFTILTILAFSFLRGGLSMIMVIAFDAPVIYIAYKNFTDIDH